MDIEESFILNLDFGKIKKVAAGNENIIPVVVQDADSKEVLVLAYVNPLALEETIKTKVVTFWSTSRNELWVKGKTSGQFLDLIEIRVNCEQNSLLFLARPRGTGSCHTKSRSGRYRTSCFYRKWNNKQLEFLKGQE